MAHLERCWCRGSGPACPGGCSLSFLKELLPNGIRFPSKRSGKGTPVAAAMFSAPANLCLALIARCLIASLGIWGILGTDAAFGEVPGMDLALGMAWRLPLTHPWVGLGAQLGLARLLLP